MIKYKETEYFTQVEIIKNLQARSYGNRDKVKPEWLTLYDILHELPMKHWSTTDFPAPSSIETKLKFGVKNMLIEFLEWKPYENACRTYRGYSIKELERYFSSLSKPLEIEKKPVAVRLVKRRN